ncbi:MAG: M48 family metalloprotease [Chitinophagaceae bacterium]|nr:M48 family metalloprotease [Chitinophagaceae bacterium]
MVKPIHQYACYFWFFKPVILLPVALVNNISTQQAETLILHELAHIRTNDYLLNWFLLTAETLFFLILFVLGSVNISGLKGRRTATCR